MDPLGSQAADFVNPPNADRWDPDTGLGLSTSMYTSNSHFERRDPPMNPQPAHVPPAPAPASHPSAQHYVPSSTSRASAFIFPAPGSHPADSPGYTYGAHPPASYAPSATVSPNTHASAAQVAGYIATPPSVGLQQSVQSQQHAASRYATHAPYVASSIASVYAADAPINPHAGSSATPLTIDVQQYVPHNPYGPAILAADTHQYDWLVAGEPAMRFNPSWTSASPYSTRSPISDVSAFRSHSHVESHRSFGATPYDRPSNPPSTSKQMSPSDIDSLMDDTKDEFVLKLIIAGPTITDDRRKGAMFQDAFTLAKDRWTGYGGVELSKDRKRRIHKWWRDWKNTLKDKVIAGRIGAAYELYKKVPGGPGEPMRDATKEEIAQRVAYQLGTGSTDIPFICEDPGNKKRAFDNNFIFEIAAHFLFQSRGNLGIKYPSRFRGHYSIVFIAFICTAIHCSFLQLRTGEKITVEFDRETFEPIYQKYYTLLMGMKDHPFYGPWLRELLSSKFATACARHCPEHVLPRDIDLNIPTDPKQPKVHVPTTAHLQIEQTQIDFNVDKYGRSLSTATTSSSQQQ